MTTNKKQLQRYLRHFFSSHGAVFSAGPSSLQSLPPLDGRGLVQVLVSVFTPPPHVTVHFDSDQSVYPPLTVVSRGPYKHSSR